MLKIDPNLRFEELPFHANQHFIFHHPDHIKLIVSGFTFILLDLSLLPLLYPFINVFYIISIPLYLFIHIWAVRLLIKNPYSTQFESLLFLGSHGVVTAIVYALLAFKISIFELGISSTFYYALLFIGLLAMFAILVFYQIKKYSNITGKSKQDGKLGLLHQLGIVLAVFPALGYSFFQGIKHNEILMNSVLLVISIFLSGFGAYMAAKQIHKYFFMKANMHFVRFIKPGGKKKRREFEKKGIIYK